MMKRGAWRATPHSVIAFAAALATGTTAAQPTQPAQPAQPVPPSAAAVLANVQQFYANATHLKATFRQVVTNATFNTTKTSDGQLFVAKPAQVRWDYLSNPKAATIAKSFVFDGTTFWLVDHKAKQIMQSSAQSSALPAAVSFLTGGTGLATQFTVAFDTSGAFGGAGATVLALTPKQPSAQYKQLLFVVDPVDWHVNESVVIDSSGDTNDIKLFNPDLKAASKPQWFQVNPQSLPTYKLVVVPGGSSQGSGSGPPAVSAQRPGLH